MTSEEEERPSFVTGGYGRHRHQWVKERVIVSVGDYFCCIHIFSAKLLISSQTFLTLNMFKN